MTKTATLNLRVDPCVKQDAEKILEKLGLTMTTAIDLYLRQISLTGGIPFSVNLPEAPDSLNINLMTDDELHKEIQKGFNDIETGKIRDAKKAFDDFRVKHYK